MKRPAFQFYPADWRKDVELRSCSVAARGLWIDMLCIAHECEPYGHLVVNGHAMTAAQIAGQVGVPLTQCAKLLDELLTNGVVRKTPEGMLYNKRMVEDERLRNVRAQAGAMGGNPDLGVNYNHAGFIYVMSRRNGDVKIGISTSPEKRAYKLRVAMSDDTIKVVAKGLVDDMGAMEKDLHQKYSQFSVGGEWFSLPESELEGLVLLVNNLKVKSKANQTPSSSSSSSPSGKNKTSAQGAVTRPPEVSETTWADFLATRKAKRAPLTQTALEGIAAEAVKAGWSLEAALKECCARGWQGLKADWLANIKSNDHDYGQCTWNQNGTREAGGRCEGKAVGFHKLHGVARCEHHMARN